MLVNKRSVDVLLLMLCRRHFCKSLQSDNYVYYDKVPTNLENMENMENLENSGNLKNCQNLRENSGNFLFLWKNLENSGKM